MKLRLLLPLALVALAGLSAAQVPAPDFWIDPVYLSPHAAVLAFRVQGPPGSDVSFFSTLDDPLAPPRPGRMRPFRRVQLDATGNGGFFLQVQGEGPLPDTWYGALVHAQGQPVVRAGVVHLAGAFATAVAPDSACVIDYERDTGQLDVRVATTPHTTVSIWEVDCSLAPFVIGQPFDTLQSGVSYLGGGVSDDSGALTWSGSEPSARCVVVIANGLLVGVKHAH